jgi:hypothetical protein
MLTMDPRDKPEDDNRGERAGYLSASLLFFTRSAST